MKYWLAEPIVDPVPAGYFKMWKIYFPDLNELAPAETRAFRKLLINHPEYLEHEVWCSKTVN